MEKEGDLGENYAEAYNGHLPFGDNPALLIVDFVMAYLDKASPLYAGVEDALASNQRILAVARKAEIPVIWTNVEYRPDGRDGGLFFRKVPALKAFLRGAATAAFPPSLKPAVDELVVTKQYPSAFFGTSLSSTLGTMGIDTLLITGLSTSGCVRATGLDAIQHGFAPFIISDACGDRHAAPHEASLFDLQAKYAEVIGEEKAIKLISSQ